MSSVTRDYNIVANLFLVLSIFATVFTIISSYQTIRINMLVGKGISYTLILEIIIDVLIVAAGILTFLKKRYGLIAFSVLFVVRMFATVPWGETTDISYALGGKFAYLMRDFGLFAIAMCFRKDGVSGWRSMLRSNKQASEDKSVIDASEKAQNDTVVDVDNEIFIPEALPLRTGSMCKELNQSDEDLGGEANNYPSMDSDSLPENTGSQVEAGIEDDSVMAEPAESSPSQEILEKSRMADSLSPKDGKRVVSIPRWVMVVCLMAFVSLFILQFVLIGKLMNKDGSVAGALVQDKDSLTWVNWSEYGLDRDSFFQNGSNAVSVYKKLENKMDSLGWSDYKEFSSMMSMVTYRMMVYNLLGRKKKYESFEEFDKTFYPATEEHLRKERDRRWLYRKLQERGIIDETYNSFCRRLCNDADLVDFYDQGIDSGLNLGKYEEFVQAVR